MYIYINQAIYTCINQQRKGPLRTSSKSFCPLQKYICAIGVNIITTMINHYDDVLTLLLSS